MLVTCQYRSTQDDTGQGGVATLAEATINSEGQLVLTGDASAFAGMLHSQRGQA